MPFLLIFFGVLFFVAAWQNRVALLTGLLIQDVSRFGTFALAIVVLWSIGLLPHMRKVSIGLISLVILTIVLTRYQDFWNNLSTIGRTAASQGPAQPISATLSPGSVGNATSTSGGGSNDIINTAISSVSSFSPMGFFL